MRFNEIDRQHMTYFVESVLSGLSDELSPQQMVVALGMAAKAIAARNAVLTDQEVSKYNTTAGGLLKSGFDHDVSYRACFPEKDKLTIVWDDKSKSACETGPIWRVVDLMYGIERQVAEITPLQTGTEARKFVDDAKQRLVDGFNSCVWATASPMMKCFEPVMRDTLEAAASQRGMTTEEFNEEWVGALSSKTDQKS